MGKTIYYRDEDWEVNDYNKRLGDENKVNEEADEEIRKIKIKRDERLDEVWRRKK